MFSNCFETLSYNGLPKFIQSKSGYIKFDSDKLFQQFYLLGLIGHEFKGKTANRLTNEALVRISEQYSDGEIELEKVSEIVKEILQAEGFDKAVEGIEQQSFLTA
jgi:hypothetical protein